jgi:sodium-coupled neutral amino acid transporter 2
MLGVGLLALPKVTSLLGIGTTLIFLVFLAFLTYLSLHYCTTASSRTGIVRYSDLVRDQTGLFGQTLLDLSLIVNGAGILIVASIVIGDILVGSAELEGLLSSACGDRSTVLAVVTVVLIFPLVSVTRLQTLAGASVLGVAAVVGWALLTLLLFIIAGTNDKLHHMNWWLSRQSKFVGRGFESAVQLIATLPVILLAFICQMSLHGVLRDLQYVRGRQIDKVALTALMITVFSYAAIGIFSYGVFGKNVSPDVLQNFSVPALEPLLSKKLAQAAFVTVRLGFLISLLGTFPLQMTPLRDALWKLLFRQELRGPGLFLVSYLLLAGILMAAATIETIWKPLVLIGSTAGVLIALIFPGLLAIQTSELLTEPIGAHRWRQVGGSVLIVVGLVIGVFGVVRVIAFKDPFEES